MLRPHVADVIEILLDSHDSHDASERIAALLGVEILEVEWRLASFPLFSLTRVPSAKRQEELRRLRGSG